jgi:hypothetical protein
LGILYEGEDIIKVTEQWLVDTYSQRNWVEVFYREAKRWLGLKEYQVRESSNELNIPTMSTIEELLRVSILMGMVLMSQR